MPRFDDYLPLVRHLLQLLGGILIARGFADAVIVEAVIGASVSLMSFWWMQRAKAAAAITAAAGAVAQAREVAKALATIPPGMVAFNTMPKISDMAPLLVAKSALLAAAPGDVPENVARSHMLDSLGDAAIRALQK